MTNTEKGNNKKFWSFNLAKIKTKASTLVHKYISQLRKPAKTLFCSEDSKDQLNFQFLKTRYHLVNNLSVPTCSKNDRFWDLKINLSKKIWIFKLKICNLLLNFTIFTEKKCFSQFQNSVINKSNCFYLFKSNRMKMKQG